jgi:hypothetical protein
MKTQALETVTAISQVLQMPMLETLMYIREHTEEFSLTELRDYYIVMADFERLLTPKEDYLEEFNSVGSRHHY